MTLPVFEKNGFHRVSLFAWSKELAQIQSVSEVQRPLLATGPVAGKMSNICGKVHAFGVRTKAAATLIDFQSEKVARELGVIEQLLVVTSRVKNVKTDNELVRGP